jgi:tRNA-dihydrouridine synthase B
VSCDTGNATPPGPAIAPGAELIDPRRAAEEFLRDHPTGLDPRIAELVPGFDAPFFQAGLAGYSDAAMRIIARRHGCPFCITEALLDRTLLAGGRGFAKADLGELEDNIPGGEEDHPLSGQIMGSDPREMAAAAIKIVEQGARREREYRQLAYPDGDFPTTRPQHLRLPGGEQIGFYNPNEFPSESPPPSCLRASVPSCLPPRTFATIDVNLACPVKKIDKKARGGHWLAEPDGALKILEAVREAVPPEIPCTLKLRRSYDDTPEMAAAFERLLDGACAIGYAWATVHARTVEQKYIGPSRWDLLRDIVQRHQGKLIFGSGDIWNAADIFRMIAYTGVCGVSVARGCIGNPWIFRQARDLMAGRQPQPPTLAEQRAVLEEHFRLALAVNAHGSSAVSQLRRAEAHTGKTMRKFGIRFATHHPRAEEVRRRFIAVSSLEQWRAVLEEFYSEHAPVTR